MRRLINSLNGRLLVLTVIFVMVAEIMIFVPSVARFRVEYLQERLELSQIASLALLATPDDMVDPDLERELLNNAEVLNIVLRRDAMRELVLSRDLPAGVSQTYDLRNPGPLALIVDALGTLLRRDDRVIRIIGRPVKGGGVMIETAMMEAPLRAAMRAYAINIFWLSMFISLLTAALLFLSARRFIVKPMRNVVSNMTWYRDDPEDVSRIIVPGASVIELREAEMALRDLQTQLAASLRQKDRLAALGGAVSRISHDLRNMLTTAQLLADRLEGIDDPMVQRISPKVVSSLDRAISLCESTLAFGKAEEPAPRIGCHNLGQIVEDVMESDRLRRDGANVNLISRIDPALEVLADSEQLFRILSNLVRNSRQAIAAAAAHGDICVTAQRTPTGIEIEVSDTGPGLPAKARENIFKPFKGGVRQGGFGLGLVIASELVRGHGGTLTLERSDARGTVFRIALPQRKTLQE